MRVKWTRQSLTDMEELLDYWEANTPVTREKKLNAVLARTDKLEIFPVMGRIEPRLAVSRPVAELRYTTVGFSKIMVLCQISWRGACPPKYGLLTRLSIGGSKAQKGAFLVQ